MNIQSWMIKSWATREWYLPPQAEPLPPFKHMGTQIRDDGSNTGLRAGDTVWVCQDGQWQVGLAWEWVEVKPGVVMLADPNSIITNLQFVDDHQQFVYGLTKTVAVNRLVHALAWQRSVCALLQAAVEPLDAVRVSVEQGATAATSPVFGPAPAWRHSEGTHGLLRGNGLIKPDQTADLHSIPPRARWLAADQSRRPRSRATDLEEPVGTVARPAMRKAA